MNLYHSEVEAIDGLHQKGFIYDFQFDGIDLLWVQGKLSVKAGNFMMLEAHEFTDEGKEETAFAIYGVLAIEHNLKGILIDHFVQPSPVFCNRLLNQYV
ncbi:MAG: hypothetical protein V4539_03885 [Bacteroidota bacterium]